jgi:hypothetical protein
MVWKDTKQIGFGIARSQNGKQRKAYFVASFYPAGNVTGSFFGNVSTLKEEKVEQIDSE